MHGRYFGHCIRGMKEMGTFHSQSERVCNFWQEACNNGKKDELSSSGCIHEILFTVILLKEWYKKLEFSSSKVYTCDFWAL